MNLVIISTKFPTVTARTKDLLQGNLTRGQFDIKGRAKGDGKKKEKKKHQNPSKQKRRSTECPLKVLWGMEVADSFTLNVVSDAMRNNKE